MRRRLPPFPAVRAFEAAARRGSFKDAAEELHVTQPAISHQIKRLEEFLGAALFHRRHQGVELTPDGAVYFADVSAILDDLDASTERVQGVDRAGALAVRATPAFTSRWLLPRMNRFSEAYPEIELQVSTTEDPMHFPTDGADVLIQYGKAPGAGVRVDPFLTSTRIPVCSPSVLENGPEIRQPGDLLRLPLLRDLVGDDWDTWFDRAGCVPQRPVRGPIFAHCELTLQAAEAGQGVALGYEALIGGPIADGRLVQLLDIDTPPKVIYSLTCPEAWINRPRTAAFRNWVFEEAAAA
jgi:LysR family glycine cleavage system transcriptional activator